MSLPATFWSKTSPASDCIVWRGAQNSKGYGCIGIDGASRLAHRVAWEDTNGPIPEGLTIDHLCRVRCCVNVAHMELVTAAENKSRRPQSLRVGGECRHGHRIESDRDLYRRKTGVVECRACRRRGASTTT